MELTPVHSVDTDRVNPAIANYFIKTRGGACVPFNDPQIEHIKTHDILRAICNTTRFTGHAPVNVGQHVLEVGRFMHDEFEPDDPERLEAALIGLVHDFPEGYVGDVSSPLKAVIKGDFRTIDSRFQAVVHRRYGLEKAREKHLPLLRQMDMRCLFEDAIRFGLDGVHRDFFTDRDTAVPRVWVPDDFVSVLPPVVMSHREAELRLWRSFVALMVETGRGALL